MIAYLKKAFSINEDVFFFYANILPTAPEQTGGKRIDNIAIIYLSRAKEQAKQPTVADGKKHRTHSKGKGDMEP